MLRGVTVQHGQETTETEDPGSTAAWGGRKKHGAQSARVRSIGAKGDGTRERKSMEDGAQEHGSMGAEKYGSTRPLGTERSMEHEARKHRSTEHGTLGPGLGALSTEL